MSTHEPIRLLEPSNLLEPLDLRDKYLRPTSSSAHRDHGPPSSSDKPRKPSAPLAAPAAPRSRWLLKSVVIIIGAVACFGAGVALPQFTSLGLFDRDRSQPSAMTTQPPAQAASMPATAQKAAPTPSLDESKKNQSSRGAPPDAKETVGRGTPPQDQQISAPNDDAHLDGAAATPAAASPATAATKPPEPAQPIAPATASKSADSPHAETQASDQHEGRIRSSRHSQRVTHRDSMRRRTAERNTENARSPAAEERDPYRAPDWQRAWGAEDAAPFARSWDRWRGREADRGWGRDPYADYAREPERRAGRKVYREDGRLIGRAPRDEVPMFRPFGSDF